MDKSRRAYIRRGEYRVSQEERYAKILKLRADGLYYGEIAEYMGISYATVMEVKARGRRANKKPSPPTGDLICDGLHKERELS